MISLLLTLATTIPAIEQPELLKRCLINQKQTEIFKKIIKTESNWNLFAINVNNGYALNTQPTNIDDAIKTAQYLTEHKFSFDAGIAQINNANFSNVELTPETAFEPCKNIQAAEKIYNEGLKKARQLTTSELEATKISLSFYNTGTPQKGIQNKYAEKVLAATELPTNIKIIKKEKTTPEKKITEPTTKPPKWDVYGNAHLTQQQDAKNDQTNNR